MAWHAWHANYDQPDSVFGRDCRSFDSRSVSLSTTVRLAGCG